MANIIKIPRVVAHIKLSDERIEMCKAFFTLIVYDTLSETLA